jgi:hypothetical protein
LWVAYALPAAVNDATDPASLMPSCRICPVVDSRYDRNNSRSTGV